ncbi:FIMAH domain-containing protein [Virgibacillus dokdonensis]|uniref:FIMAH domain-containing protein n=1 Tax=Virgibacillus dokdonensis TaxID=302167 RepID=A0ABU7VFJ3_9BACI
MKKHAKKGFAITLFVASILLLLPTMTTAEKTNPISIAHRGASGQAPENTMAGLVERFEGKELSSKTAHALKVQLTAIHQYEKQSLQDKVIKHLNGFITLLNHQKEHGFISNRAYQILLGEANFLVEDKTN